MSSLLEAAKLGDHLALDRILSESNFSTTFEIDDKGYTAAHWTVYFDESNSVEALLLKCSDIFLISSSRGITPLHLICLNNSIRSLKLLLNYPIIYNKLIDMRTIWSETPLHLAASTGNLEITRLMLNNNTNCNNFDTAHLSDNSTLLQAVDKWGRTPIDVAIENGYTAVITYFETAYPELCQQSIHRIKSNSAYSNTDKTNNTWSSSHCVIKDIQNELLQSNLFQRNKQGASSTHDVIKTLDSSTTSHVSDQSLVSLSSPLPSIPTVTIIPPTSSPPPSAPRPVLRALSKLIEYPGDPDHLITLLADPTVDPMGKDMYGWTSLHKFASWDKTDLLDILLTSVNNIDINIRGHDQFTCIHAAVDMNAIHAVRYLLQYTNTSTATTDTHTYTGTVATTTSGTASTNSTSFKHTRMPQPLDLTLTDKKGRTARDLAVEKGNAEMISLLS